jgi:hypothetical protein
MNAHRSSRVRISSHALLILIFLVELFSLYSVFSSYVWLRHLVQRLTRAAITVNDTIDFATFHIIVDCSWYFRQPPFHVYQ